MATVPITDKLPLNNYIAIAGQTKFDFTFWIKQESDLNVLVNDVEVSNYTFHENSLGDDSGGSIDLDTPLAGGEVVTLLRNVTLERISDFKTDLRPAVLNNELSLYLAAMQELKRDTSKSARYKDSSLATETPFFPEPVDDYVIAFDGAAGKLKAKQVDVAAIDAAVTTATNAASTATAGANTATTQANSAADSKTAAESAAVQAQNAADSLQVGTAATRDVGVAAGQIPLLDADAKLEKSVLPASGGPIGSIGFFPTLVAVPANYLIMDGSTFDETVYPDLYAALGNVNTLLDCRGYFPRFSDLGRGVDSGRQPGTFQADDYKSHAHRGRVPSDFRYVTSGSNKVMMGNFQPSESGTLTYPESSSYSGGTETRPKNVSFIAAIRAE